MAKSVGKGPLSVERLGEQTWHVHGPPASAVNIALYHLAPSCDFVISGPNVGHNVGRCGTRTRQLLRLSRLSKLFQPLCRLSPVQVLMLRLLCVQGVSSVVGHRRRSAGGRAGRPQGGGNFVSVLQGLQ